MSVKTPEQKAKCGTRYPARCHRYAQEMWDEGYTVPEIRERLAAFGYYPSPAMIHRWCRPEIREAVNLAKRNGPKAKRERRMSPWWIKRERMRELRGVGLSALDVARVMNLDYGMSLHRDQVRAILGESSKPLKNPKMVIDRASR